MSLQEFTKNYNPRTDKYDLGYIKEFYSALFEPINSEVKNVLEIGIYKGDSILLWRDYFKNAVVRGVDINYCRLLENQERIIPIYNNAYDFNFVNSLSNDFFDIIIDDGPHTLESMTFFLQNYLQKVKPGGFLILEDIIDRSWTPILLKLIDNSVQNITVHDMRMKQLNEPLLNKWKNGLDVIVITK